MPLLVSDLIYTAMRLAGVLPLPGRTPSPSDLNDGLLALNSLIDRWTNERLMVYQVARTLVPITASKAAYTIGPSGADWTLPWPPRIDNASIIIESATPGPYELAMHVLESYEQWQAVPLKNTPSTFPRWCYYDRSYPLGTFNVWPVPQESNQVALYLSALLPQLTAASQVVLPPGYQRALEYGLAVELIPRYPHVAVASPFVIQEARDAKAELKSINALPIIAGCDRAVRAGTGGIYDWRADIYH